MTSKTQAIAAGIVAGIAQFVGWLATLPPESQTSFVAPILALLPIAWRTDVGVWMKGLTGIATMWGFYKASHSGPNTPPKNSPNE